MAPKRQENRRTGCDEQESATHHLKISTLTAPPRRAHAGGTRPRREVRRDGALEHLIADTAEEALGQFSAHFVGGSPAGSMRVASRSSIFGSLAL